MNPETPDHSRSPENNDHASTPKNEATEGGRHAKAAGADSGPRMAADRVGQWLAPLLQRLMQWLSPLLQRVQNAPAVRRLRERVAPHVPESVKSASRLRPVQVGAGVAAVGVVGLIIGGLAGGGDQRDVEEAAVAAPMQAQQAPVQQAPVQQAAPQPAEQKKAEPPQTRAETKSETKSEAKSEEPKKEAPLGPPIEGIDVSNHNGNIDWKKVAEDNKKFTFVLASDGTNFTNPKYSQQYHGAKDAGLIAGAYHFARPDDSDGATQANRFLDIIDYKNDGKTLPPVLDLEVDPNGGSCYGKSVDGMHQWTKSFNDTVKQRTGKDPIIYANPSFWKQCMGGTDSFSNHNLWLAAYEVDSPTVPKGFQDWDFWQYTDKGKVAGISGNTDINQYKEGIERLKQLAS
ncbi:lysozyme [Saccharopolyspora mangrovi]|uniref:Lysozyme n=1 Tax=Saccharopolyspora mangrovi TaxID=3082379 RepID=A0ABU6AI28_9PSEU|nr:lysozyme [Saccharopolyspora sp. S2-29]MEB3371039.1 lysozyme [Saccharopolyspora sp. S2-29]